MNELWSYVPLFEDRADAGKVLAAELENECGPGLARRTASTTASGPHTFRNVSFNAREGRSLGALRRARRSNLDGSIGPLAEVRIRGAYRVIDDLGKWHRLDHRAHIGRRRL